MRIPQNFALAADAQPYRVLGNGDTLQPNIKIYAAVVRVGGCGKICGMRRAI